MILIFFGPPGAGKGTQANLIAKKLKIPHLSTGDILRKKLTESDNLSITLKKIMDTGHLVSDNILNQIVSNRLTYRDCKNGFILDGYPRTIAQKDFLSNFLDKNKLEISYIFDLEINEEIIADRIYARSNIENRLDDKKEIIKTRIAKYFKETRPLSEFYSSIYPKKYNIIDGNQEIEMIERDILKIIKI